MGCWKDKHDRAINGDATTFGGDDRMQQCINLVADNKRPLFGMQVGDRCSSTGDSRSHVTRHGRITDHQAPDDPTFSCNSADISGYNTGGAWSVAL